jgi:cell division protein FtsB
MADTDGVEWAAGFLSHDAFEGRYGYDGTHQRLKKSIKNVRAAMEGGIDVTFPAQLHPKANAVFKMQLKLTVEQCLGFLDALSPLFKRVSRSGLSAKENWLRVLAFAKHVFDDVANVRTINSEATMGSMVWASFRTSELLKSYQTHKWVGHPQTSSILAFTSIQKKGKAQKEMQSALDTLKSTTSCLEREVNKVKEDQKEMICKNTSLA